MTVAEHFDVRTDLLEPCCKRPMINDTVITASAKLAAKIGFRIVVSFLFVAVFSKGTVDGSLQTARTMTQVTQILGKPLVRPVRPEKV